MTSVFGGRDTRFVHAIVANKLLQLKKINSYLLTVTSPKKTNRGQSSWINREWKKPIQKIVVIII